MPTAVAAAAERLEVSYPVALDFDYALWRDYGCEGWPSLFLWAPGGALAYFHFGEGEYRATEEAIHELLRSRGAATRAAGATGAAASHRRAGGDGAAPSAEVLPGGSPSQPWSGRRRTGARATRPAAPTPPSTAPASWRWRSTTGPDAPPGGRPGPARAGQPCPPRRPRAAPARLRGGPRLGDQLRRRDAELRAGLENRFKARVANVPMDNCYAASGARSPSRRGADGPRAAPGVVRGLRNLPPRRPHRRRQPRCDRWAAGVRRHRLGDGGAMFLGNERLPDWFEELSQYVGIAIISAIVALDGDTTSFFALFYLWLAVQSAYFTHWKRAASRAWRWHSATASRCDRDRGVVPGRPLADAGRHRIRDRRARRLYARAGQHAGRAAERGCQDRRAHRPRQPQAAARRPRRHDRGGHSRAAADTRPL